MLQRHLSNQILTEGKPAVDRYINEFLKAGCSDYPIEVLKKAGVDMNTAAPIEEACRVFEEKLNELEQLLLGENNEKLGYKPGFFYDNI